MKPQRLLTTLLCFLICGEAFAQTQEMDKELAALTEKLGAKIKAAGKKKITVLDFADLDGNTTDLGKYVAEQLTVEFVTEDRGFTVVDRANLKKILEEHKLTASGLVNPENAKKLGSFSGVDALILGTIVPMTPNIKLTAKIIATDTADIVGAGQCTFKADENVQTLLTHTAPAGETTTADKRAPVFKPIGDLQVLVESLKLSANENYVNTRLTLIITNTSPTQTYGVGLLQDPYNNFKLSNRDSDNFDTTKVIGINTMQERNGNFNSSPTEVPPRGSIILVANGQRLTHGSALAGGPYRLQTVLLWGVEDNGNYPMIKKHTLIMDIE